MRCPVSEAPGTFHLEDGRLPALDFVQKQFASSAGGSHRLRGVEVEFSGVARAERERPSWTGRSRPPVRLSPLDPAAVVRWDASAGSPVAVTFADWQPLTAWA